MQVTNSDRSLIVRGARVLLAGTRWKLAVGVIAASLLSGCTAPLDMLDPRGPRAARVADLWWFMFWLGLAVYVVVLVLLFYAVWRAWRRRAQPEARPRLGQILVWGGGIIVPIIVLLATLIYTIRIGAEVAAPPKPTELTIEVIGHMFWWEVHYPDQEIMTANEIHIPVGQPVEIQLTSVDVIHSFWVPQLHGKIDLNPWMSTSMWIQADEPGVYRGECAEFCGVQHARMAFQVVAQPPEEFAAWLEQQRQPAPQPTDPRLLRGQAIFIDAGCAQCHRIEGVTASTISGTPGPDLTHIGSRRTLAAATLENTRGNLAAWIVDPQAIKPGNNMPPTNLNSEDLLALLTYLESLE